MTRSPSTTSRAGSVTLSPVPPGSLSTLTTSSSATFSCLPPQRTIAYTRELSFLVGFPSVPRHTRGQHGGSLARGPRIADVSQPLRLPDRGPSTNTDLCAERLRRWYDVRRVD